MKHTIFVGLLLLAMFAGGAAHAAAPVWIANDGDYTNNANWSGGTAPGNGDGSSFTNNNSYTVSFTSDSPIIASNYFNGKGTATLDITSHIWTITNFFSIARSGNSTATVYLAGGTLAVTNIPIGAVTNGVLRVGDTGNSKGALNVTNGVVIVVGAEIGANSTGIGTLTISGSGVWTNSISTTGIGTITVGSGSAGNSLLVTNGGKMFASTITIGSGSAASNNLFKVDNATVTNVSGGVTIGLNSAAGGQNFNQLIVTNGGKLFSVVGNVGTASGNNTAIVTGNGSVWDIGNNILRCGVSANGSSNLILVTSGGVLTNALRIFIPDSGGYASNAIVVADGGKLFNSGSILVGNTSSASNNLFQVGGAGNPSIGNLGTICVGQGSNASANKVVITNASVTTSGDAVIGNNTFAFNNSGTVSAGGTLDLQNKALRIGALGSAGNSLSIVGGGVLTNVNALYINDNTGAAGNSLLIADGGKLFSGGVGVGQAGGSSNSLYQVGGAGNPSSVVNTSVTVGVSASSVFNQLLVTNALLKTVADSGIGANATASNNVGTVTSGGTWDLGYATLRVGYGGAASSNSLVITGGGVVSNLNRAFLADNGPGVGNSLTISDGGQLLISNYVVVAQASGATGNRLTVSAGGKLFTGADCAIGNVSATHNVGTITGGGSVWDLGGMSLRIGGNTVTNVSCSGNALIVTAGGMLTNAYYIAVPDWNPGISNSLAVSDGGKVFTTGGILIGNLGGSSGNSYFVGGAGASATASNLLVTIGSAAGSRFNQLVVTNALFNSGTLTVGNATTSNNTASVLAGATVDMLGTRINAGGIAGSLVINAGVITNAGGVIIGNASHQNALIITNGGKLFTGLGAADFYEIGRGPNSTSNSVTIAGGGATWDAGGRTVFVGRNIGGNLPTNNSLTVSSGGVFTNGTLWVADGPNESLLINGGKVAVTELRVFAGQSATFSSGTLEFSNDLRVDGTMLGAATVTVPSGTTLMGIGSLANPVTVANGGILAPGDSVGTLAISNNLVLNSTSVLNFEIGTSGTDQVVVVGDLTLDGQLNVTANAGFTNADYTLMTYTGLLTNNVLTVNALPGSLTGSIVAGGGTVVLHVTSGGPAPGSYEAWAAAYGLTGSEALGSADPDGDGMSNTNEFLAGFNPTNSAAYAHIISVAKSNTVDMSVTYLGANGDSTYSGGPATRTNVLEYALVPANGSYTNNFVGILTNSYSGGTGLGTNVTVTDSFGATNQPSRFYRVRVLVP